MPCSQTRIAELKSRIGEGGLREAAIRALLYVGSARGMVDERSIEALRQVRRDHTGARLTLAEFKMLVREQFFMLLLDREAALAAIPKLLPDDVESEDERLSRRCARCCRASGDITGERRDRLKRVAELFGVETAEVADIERRPFRSQGEGIVTRIGRNRE